jgi:hypothetical protein
VRRVSVEDLRARLEHLMARMRAMSSASWKCLRGLCSYMPRGLSFRVIMDVTTLLSSVATVAALGLTIYTLRLLLHDRIEQGNTAAWQLLQSYVEHKPRARFNEGQGFALETLVRNGIDLGQFDGDDSVIFGADLHGAYLPKSSFRRSSLESVILSDANLWDSSLDEATIFHCLCERVDLKDADLFKAKIEGGKYGSANFKEADISDLSLEAITWAPRDKAILDIESLPSELDFSPDAFVDACYQRGHEPDLRPAKVHRPSDPQGSVCTKIWGKKWAARDKADSAGH